MRSKTAGPQSCGPSPTKTTQPWPSTVPSEAQLEDTSIVDVVGRTRTPPFSMATDSARTVSPACASTWWPNITVTSCCASGMHVQSQVDGSFHVPLWMETTASPTEDWARETALDNKRRRVTLNFMWPLTRHSDGRLRCGGSQEIGCPCGHGNHEPRHHAGSFPPFGPNPAQSPSAEKRKG